MIKTKGILHVTIPVSDLARSRAFYTEILGLEFVAQVPKENPHFVFLKSGADYVILGRDTSSGRFWNTTSRKQSDRRASPWRRRWCLRCRR